MERRVMNDPKDVRARRIAKNMGLLARKSRWRHGTIDNRGGFMLFDPLHNLVIGGERFDLSAEAVIEFCRAAGSVPRTIGGA
jgi:hypothetical protein